MVVPKPVIPGISCRSGLRNRDMSVDIFAFAAHAHRSLSFPNWDRQSRIVTISRRSPCHPTGSRGLLQPSFQAPDRVPISHVQCGWCARQHEPSLSFGDGGNRVPSWRLRPEHQPMHPVAQSAHRHSGCIRTVQEVDRRGVRVADAGCRNYLPPPQTSAEQRCSRCRQQCNG